MRLSSIAECFVVALISALLFAGGWLVTSSIPTDEIAWERTCAASVDDEHKVTVDCGGYLLTAQALGLPGLLLPRGPVPLTCTAYRTRSLFEYNNVRCNKVRR